MSVKTVTPLELAQIALAHPEAPQEMADHVGRVFFDDVLYVARIEAAA